MARCCAHLMTNRGLIIRTRSGRELAEIIKLNYRLEAVFKRRALGPYCRRTPFWKVFTTHEVPRRRWCATLQRIVEQMNCSTQRTASNVDVNTSTLILKQPVPSLLQNFVAYFLDHPLISSLSKSCYSHIRQLRCIRPYLDSKTASTIAASIVHSKLD